jgi:hypothetical protein
MFVGKLGLDKLHPKVLGIFQTGTNTHEWIEENFQDEMDGEFEKPLNTVHESGIEFVGHCDYYDPEEEVVYDFKTRGGFYNLDPTNPKDKYLDQLTVYMYMLGITRAKLVWINKKNMQIVQYPTQESPQDYFAYSEKRMDDILQRCNSVRNAIQETGVEIESEDEIPFDKCGCYQCRMESLAIEESEVPETFTTWQDEGEKPQND